MIEKKNYIKKQKTTKEQQKQCVHLKSMKKKLYFDIKTNKNCKQKFFFIRWPLTASTRCIEFLIPFSPMISYIAPV